MNRLSKLRAERALYAAGSAVMVTSFGWTLYKLIVSDGGVVTNVIDLAFDAVLLVILAKAWLDTHDAVQDKLHEARKADGDA